MSAEGSFSQGNIVLFGVATSPQYACNAMFAIC